jgi:hypothetical protein
LSSFETDFPLMSEIVSLKFANYFKKNSND